MQKNKIYTDFLYIDSGSGGLPYLAYLLEHFPGYRSVYIADTKNFPYGEKSKDDIIQAITSLVENLLKIFDPKIIIIACNTISVTALDVLRSLFSPAFVGTVPAIKQAIHLSQNKRLGLLATENTVSSPYTDALFADYKADFQLIKRGDPKLVSFVENSFQNASEEEKEKALLPAIDFFKKENIDVLILACTHFVHLMEEIKRIAPKNWQIIDSRAGVIKRALHIAKEKGIEPQAKSQASFYATKPYLSHEEAELRSYLSSLSIEWKGEI